MADYLFQWTDNDGISHRISIMSTDVEEAWFRAARECGHANLNSLGMVGDDRSRQIRNGIVVRFNDICYKYKKLNLAVWGNQSDRKSTGWFTVFEFDKWELYELERSRRVLAGLRSNMGADQQALSNELGKIDRALFNMYNQMIKNK